MVTESNTTGGNHATQSDDLWGALWTLFCYFVQFFFRTSLGWCIVIPFSLYAAYKFAKAHWKGSEITESCEWVNLQITWYECKENFLRVSFMESAWKAMCCLFFGAQSVFWMLRVVLAFLNLSQTGKASKEHKKELEDLQAREEETDTSSLEYDSDNEPIKPREMHKVGREGTGHVYVGGESNFELFKRCMVTDSRCKRLFQSRVKQEAIETAKDLLQDDNFFGKVYAEKIQEHAHEQVKKMLKRARECGKNEPKDIVPKRRCMTTRRGDLSESD
jgi:hypothetical protein